MVGRVLSGNGITRYGDGLYSLIGAEELSDSERDALLQLCRQRLDGFREQRGEELVQTQWDSMKKPTEASQVCGAT
jgi:ATP adenylyltransferase